MERNREFGRNFVCGLVILVIYLFMSSFEFIKMSYFVVDICEEVKYISM